MFRPFVAAGSAIALLLPAGCAAPISAPPLERRAAEARAVPLPEAVREPDAPVDPAVAAGLRDALAAAAADAQRFDAARGEAARLVRAAAGQPPGSEAWTAAEEAASALESARAPLRDAVDRVEQLRADPAAAGSGSRGAIDAAAAELRKRDEAQARAVAALVAELR